MRLVESNYLADGKLFNRGQKTTLIEIERDEDYDALLRNILDSGYYAEQYFRTHSGLEDSARVAHLWTVAEMVRALRPRRVLDIGCGRGDVISLLHEHGVAVTGVDFGENLRPFVWPNVRDRFVSGDFRDLCRELAKKGERFDTICAFDIWEHLHPGELERSIRAITSVASDDALFVFIIPAFGQDRVFGEQFPLELEENRSAFEARDPFRYLIAEHVNPPIPASGHLIWAHTQWWENQFGNAGLQRLTDVERALHQTFDVLLPFSGRSFYVFAREGGASDLRTRDVVSRSANIQRTITAARLVRDAATGTIRRELVGLARLMVENSAPTAWRPIVSGGIEKLRQLRNAWRR